MYFWKHTISLGTIIPCVSDHFWRCIFHMWGPGPNSWPRLWQKKKKRKWQHGMNEAEWGAYLAPLSIEASPLLCFLDNVAQLLVGQLHILRQEIHPFFGCQPLKDVKHTAIVVKSGRHGVKWVAGSVLWEQVWCVLIDVKIISSLKPKQRQTLPCVRYVNQN